MTEPALHVVSWNLTQRCNLSCSHCYLDADARLGAGDLSTEQCLRIVDELASVNPSLLLILTGGEPLLRPDLTTISRAAADRGILVVLGTNGTLLDAKRARELSDHGVSGVGISVDAFAHPELHDRLRGRPGAWDGALRGLAACAEAGLDFIVQTSVFRWNRDELATIADFAAELGAQSWNLYFLVCTGRGQQLTDLTPLEYEDVLHEIRALQRELTGRLLVAVRCAPQYKRIVAHDPDPRFAFHAYESGCPAAINYVRIGERGQVTACPYMPQEAGQLGVESFAKIWATSPQLTALRDRSLLRGRCGACSFRETCGGCRARALALLDDPLGEDPSCSYEEDGRTDVATPPEPTFALPSECTIPWTEQAVVRLDRVPSFLKGLVIRRVEKAAHERGDSEVTPELMKAVRARMHEGGAGAPLSTVLPATRGEEVSSGLLTWTPEALERLGNAPDFVRAGILKLMKLRAEQHGKTTITSEFLSEIRDESMMRVSRIMRRFGLDELRPEAFDEARRRMAKHKNKLMVIDQIQEFLQKRPGQNEALRAKFRTFLAAAGGPGLVWMPDAKQALDAIDEPLRSPVREAAECSARRLKVQVITKGLVTDAHQRMTVEQSTR